MDLIFSTEMRFFRTPEGQVWAPYVNPSFWDRYLAHFERLHVLARVGSIAAPHPGWNRVDREGVIFIPLEYYVGPRGFLLSYRTLVRQVRERALGKEAVIMRLPSMIGTILHRELTRVGKPYGIEVVGDPHGVFSPGAVRHPLRPFLRWWGTGRLETQCRGAAAAAFVTRRALQVRYKTFAGAFSTWFTDVDLTPECYASIARPERPQADSANLITVASLEMPYKGVDVLIEAIRRCVARGSDVRLTVVGDGRHRPNLERQVAEVGLGGRVAFLGMVQSGKKIRDLLDNADIFVLASRTEGLPRAMLEAMARGLPCIGTDVGGVAELIDSGSIVSPDDPAALAGIILKSIREPGLMARMSQENLERAREYSDEAMYSRRNQYYGHIKEVHQRWLMQGTPIAGLK
jgi:phosphatidyl-myo-inositol dimannoside synthase